MFFSFDYVIKEMLNVAAVQPWSYGCTWEVCWALKKLESHSAIASWDSYSSFVLSNLPRASITPWLHAARLPFLNGLEAQSSKDTSQQNSIAIKKSSSKLRHESKLIQWKSEGVVYLSKLLWWQRETSSDKHIITFCQFGYHKICKWVHVIRHR